MWRSGCSPSTDRSIAAVRYTVLAVGRVKPPFSDDVQHYQRLIARHARLSVVEVREDELV
jgi:23S rRNA (pseudouridine1915-N3)-methyltransferase